MVFGLMGEFDVEWDGEFVKVMCFVVLVLLYCFGFSKI